jgi:hypothetical protein
LLDVGMQFAIRLLQIGAMPDDLSDLGVIDADGPLNGDVEISERILRHDQPRARRQLVDQHQLDSFPADGGLGRLVRLRVTADRSQSDEKQPSAHVQWPLP